MLTILTLLEMQSGLFKVHLEIVCISVMVLTQIPGSKATVRIKLYISSFPRLSSKSMSQLIPSKM